MAKYCFFVSGIALMLLAACKKDSTNPPITYPTYAPLAIGNYWIYERFNVDASGNSTALGTYDSCYIEKDTLINNVTYYKMVRPSFSLTNPITYIRDSLHFLIDANGPTLFSSQNFTDTFSRGFVTAGPNDTVCFVYTKMADKDLSVTTGAGTFITSCLKTTYNMYPNWSNEGNPRFISTRYAENIGVVTETIPFYTANPNYTERRLVRYRVQ